MDGVTFAEIASIFKILAVLTSALFAISQYYENRQHKTIEVDQQRIREIDLSQQDSIKDSVKNIYEKIMNVTPIHNQAIIVCLFLLICVLILLFFLSLVEVFSLLVLHTILIFYSFIIVILSCWIFINWRRMQNQLTAFKFEVTNFKNLSDAFKKFIEVNKNSTDISN
jgi:hypothetical protein